MNVQERSNPCTCGSQPKPSVGERLDALINSMVEAGAMKVRMTPSGHPSIHMIGSKGFEAEVTR